LNAITFSNSRSRSSVIQNILSEQVHGQYPIPLAYFYCARNAQEPQRANPDEVLGALLKQLATPNLDRPILPQVLDTYNERRKEADEDGGELQRLNLENCVKLILGFTDTSPAILVIDALDECRCSRLKLPPLFSKLQARLAT
jgi:hypothetical protein